MKPNLKDFTMDFYVDYEIEKGEKETRDVPRTDDYISVKKVFLEGKEIDSSRLRNHLEWHINLNPELIGLEMNDGEVNLPII